MKAVNQINLIRKQYIKVMYRAIQQQELKQLKNGQIITSLTKSHIMRYWLLKNIKEKNFVLYKQIVETILVDGYKELVNNHLNKKSNKKDIYIMKFIKEVNSFDELEGLIFHDIEIMEIVNSINSFMELEVYLKSLNEEMFLIEEPVEDIEIEDDLEEEKDELIPEENDTYFSTNQESINNDKKIPTLFDYILEKAIEINNKPEFAHFILLQNISQESYKSEFIDKSMSVQMEKLYYYLNNISCDYDCLLKLYAQYAPANKSFHSYLAKYILMLNIDVRNDFLNTIIYKYYSICKSFNIKSKYLTYIERRNITDIYRKTVNNPEIIEEVIKTVMDFECKLNVFESVENTDEIENYLDKEIYDKIKRKFRHENRRN